jgi:hypothetical protein
MPFFDEGFTITENRITVTGLCTQTFTMTRCEDTEEKALQVVKAILSQPEGFYERSGTKYRIVTDECTGNYCDKVYVKVILAESETKIITVHLCRKLT